MELFEAIKNRRSIRKYKKGFDIPQQDIIDIAETGKYAASGRGEYPWKFVIVQGERLLELTRIVGGNGVFMASASACIVVICKDVRYYIEDGAAAAQNILLAAYAKGYGACWIAGDKKDYAPQVLTFINAPAGYKLVVNICLGLPLESPIRQKPANKDVIIWDKIS